jgi:hypothetical protein
MAKRITGKGVIMHMHVPRLHIHRLVYALMGAALAIGLLVTAFVRPQPTLTAATSCYGLCPTVTTLVVRPSYAPYGREWIVKFYVRAIARTPGTGVPPGYIEVRVGKYLCRARLYNGSGNCSPTATALGRGTFRALATYTGSSSFQWSKSNYGYVTVR